MINQSPKTTNDKIRKRWKKTIYIINIKRTRTKKKQTKHKKNAGKNKKIKNYYKIINKIKKKWAKEKKKT